MTLGTKFGKVKIEWSIHIVDLIVVIIGVSVAFGISNWASKQKQQKEIEVILNTMATEIERDIDVYTRHQIPVNSKIANKLQGLIDVVYADELNEDSLKSYIKSNVLSTYNWPVSRSTYESLIQSGRMDMIENYELKLNMRNLYQVRHAQSNFIMDLNMETTKELMSILNETIDFRDESTYMEVADSRKFRNLLVKSKRLTQGKVSEYQESVVVLTELLEDIKVELGSDYIESTKPSTAEE